MGSRSIKVFFFFFLGIENGMLSQRTILSIGHSLVAYLEQVADKPIFATYYISASIFVLALTNHHPLKRYHAKKKKNLGQEVVRLKTCNNRDHLRKLGLNRTRKTSQLITNPHLYHTPARKVNSMQPQHHPKPNMD